MDLEENWNKIGYMQEDRGLNIINENNESKILFKIPGADTNPYLTVFSLLTSVLI